MIYRIHKYDANKGDRNGHFLGYVSLCDGYINAAYVYDHLVDAKIIPSAWLSKGEVSLVGNGATKAGLGKYILYKRTPKTYVFTIYPIDVKLYNQPSYMKNENLTYPVFTTGQTFVNQINWASSSIAPYNIVPPPLPMQYTMGGEPVRYINVPPLPPMDPEED